MGICEYVKELLRGCPILEGEVISVGFFDERLGGTAVMESGGKSVVREYTDGGRLVEERAKIVFSHIGGMGDEAEIAARERIDGICTWVEEQSRAGVLAEFGSNAVVSAQCIAGEIIGNVGTQKRESECIIRYLERKGEV